MRTNSFLLALVLSLLMCTISGAEPTAKLKPEPDAEFAAVSPGVWFDLLVEIDPEGLVIAAEGLKIRAEAGDGAEFLAPILPPPRRKGDSATDDLVYDKTFVVRLPMRVPDTMKRKITASIAGKLADGKPLSIGAEGKVAAWDQNKGHVTGKASLKTSPAKVGEPNAVVLDLTVMEPYHVYGAAVDPEIGMPVSGRLIPGHGAEPKAYWVGGGPAHPPGDKLHGAFRLEIPFTPAVAGKLNLRALINWQACTEQFCDQNEVAYLPLGFDVQAGRAPAIEEAAAPTASDLGKAGVWELIVASILGALFALAMPCTYPMIPITISFFTKQAEKQHHKVLPLAVAYGAGIVVIFVLIGLVVGQPIIEFATLWWVNALFALLFLVFGLSLIGMYNLRLPSSVENLAAKASGTGGFFSVFAMGATLVITSFTCTAPIIGIVLVAAAKGGSLWLIGLAMGVFGLTMAIPFVFLALSPQAIQKMPRSGEWMQKLKVTLGIVELGLVLKFVSNIDLARGWFVIGRELFLFLWGLSFLFAALYLFGVFDLLRKGAKWSLGRGRAISGAILLVITAYLYSGLGGKPLYSNLEAFLPIIPNAGGVHYSDGFLAVAHESYEEGLELAKEKNAPIFLHFTGFQ